MIVGAVSWHSYFESSLFEVSIDYKTGYRLTWSVKNNPWECKDYCMTRTDCVGFTWYNEFEQRT